MPYFMRVSNGLQKDEKSLFEHFCGQNVVTKQVYNDKSPGTQRQFVAKFRGLLVWHSWQSAERDKFESAYTYYITFRRLRPPAGQFLQSCLPAENIPQIR